MNLKKYPTLGKQYCSILNSLYCRVDNSRIVVENEFLSGVIYLVKSPVTPGEYKIEYVSEKITFRIMKYNPLSTMGYKLYEYNIEITNSNCRYPYNNKMVTSKIVYHIFKEIIEKYPELVKLC